VPEVTEAGESPGSANAGTNAGTANLHAAGVHGPER